MSCATSFVSWLSGLLAFLASTAGPASAGAGTLAEAVADRVAAAMTLQGLPFLSIEDVESLRVEIRDFVAASGPKELPEGRQLALLGAIEPFIAEHFPKSNPDKTYVEYRDQVGTLKWVLWLALTRKELGHEELEKRDEQREWMRDYINGLADHPQFGTRAEELAKLERFLADPLFPPFQAPMTDAQFAAFKQPFERRASHAGNACGQLILRAFHAVCPLDQWVRKELPFGDRVRGFLISNTRFILTFESTAALTPRGGTIQGLGGRKDTLFDLTRLSVMPCPAGPGEASLEKWLREADKGDLAYDEKAKALLALRGAKIALLDVGTWFAADALSDAQLRERLAQHGTTRIPVGSFRFRDPDPNLKTPIAFVAVEKPGHPLDVVRVAHWARTDGLGIALRARSSSLTRRPPEKAEETPAALHPGAAQAPEVALPQPEYGQANSFQEVAFSVSSSHRRDRNAQITIKPDGWTTYSLRERTAGKEINYSTRLRLALEHLRSLESLLEKTGWLAHPGPAVVARVEDGEQYTVVLVREGATRRRTWEYDRAEPYWPLERFFRRLDRQERLLWQLTEGDADARLHAASDVEGEIRGIEGESGTMPPAFPLFDCGRFVPAFAKILARPEGAREDEFAAAVWLMGHLRLDAQRNAIAALARHSSQPVRTAVIGAMVRFGDEAAAQTLAGMARGDSRAAWGLIRMGKAAVPTIAEVLEKAGSAHTTGAYQLIRAYLDHWSELPGLDPAVVQGVRKNLEASRWGRGLLQYHQEFLRLAESSPPPPGSLTCRVTPQRAETRQPPYTFQWGIARLEPLRLVHGWYTLADGQVAEHGGAADRAPVPDRTGLELQVFPEGGKLVLEMKRTDWRLDGSSETATSQAAIPIPPGAAVTHVSYLEKPTRLSERHQTLWRADVAREGKVVKTVFYAARIAAQDEPAAPFAPPAPKAGEAPAERSTDRGLAAAPVPRLGVAIERRHQMALKALNATPPDAALLRKALEDMGHVLAIYRGEPVDRPAEGQAVVTVQGKTYALIRVPLDRKERGAAPDDWLAKLAAPLKGGHPLLELRLAMALRPDVAPRLERALADADAAIRSGLLRLARNFPQLQKTNDGALADALAGASPAGTIRIRAVLGPDAQKGAQPAVAEADRYSVVVAIEPLDWGNPSPQQPAMTEDLHLALRRQVSTSAGSPELAAALRRLAAEALDPLNHLGNVAYEMDGAEESRRRDADADQEAVRAQEEAIRRQRERQNEP